MGGFRSGQITEVASLLLLKVSGKRERQGKRGIAGEEGREEEEKRNKRKRTGEEEWWSKGKHVAFLGAH